MKKIYVTNESADLFFNEDRIGKDAVKLINKLINGE